MVPSSNGTVRVFASSVLVRIAMVLLGFINSIVINRYLGVSLRGEYTMVINYANIAQLFMNMGIGNSYPAFKKSDPGCALRFFLRISAGQLAIYCIALAAISVCSGGASELLFIGVLAVVQVFENQTMYMALVEDITARNRAFLATSVLYTAALIVSYFVTSGSLEVIVLVTAGNYVASSLCFLVIALKHRSGEGVIRRGLGREVLSVAIPTMLMNVLIFCNYNLDVILLERIQGDYFQLGLYGTAVTLGNMLWKLPDAFKEVLFNRAAKRDNPDEVTACVIINVAIALIIVVGFALIGRWFLRVFYGADFEGAYPLVLLLFVGTLPMILYKMIHPLYVTNKKTKLVVAILGSSVILNCVFCTVLIPSLGAVGAALSSVISYSVCGIAFWMKFRADYGVKLLPTTKSLIQKASEFISKRGSV